MRVNYEEYIQTEEWRQRAEAAKARVGQRCQICNRPAPRVILEVHHRTYERLGQERPEDLTVLCRGCRELYTTNRRMPRPPQAQPAEQSPAQEPIAGAPKQQPLAVHTQARRPLVPAKQNHQPSTQPINQSTPLLTNHLAPIYQLTLDASTNQQNSIYGLIPDQPTPLPQGQKHPLWRTAQADYPPNRGRQIGLATLVLLLLFVLLSLFDFRPQVSLRLPSATLALTVQPLATPTRAPTLTTVLATATPLPTPVSPTPTLASTPQPATATPLYADAAPPVVNQRLVNQTALVCGKPCSCAPVVRTIARGAPVNVLETTRCQGDTWYKIAENEWLGPRLLDEDAVVTTTP